MNIKEYYFALINELNKYTLFNGMTALLDNRVVEGFQLKNAEYLTEWEPNAMFLFSFTIKDNAPDNVFADLLDIYARKYPGMADLFVPNEDNSVKMYAMTGDLQ